MVDDLFEQTKRAPAPVTVISPKDTTSPGISSLTLTPNVNLIMKNVSFFGLDWIEGLRKLSLSGRTVPPLPHHVPFLTAEDELGKDSSFAPVLTERVSDPFPVLEEPPSSMLESEPKSPPEESCPSPSESTESIHFLRSSTKTVSGLGKVSSPVRRSRGRKKNLSKAQSRAREDLLEGKQQTIERALRAKKAKKKG